ncbi:hypothetical protein B0A69_01125 [Chryseobacterium shigense]|uniref:HEAT repeat-containing protein n=1 Tax=Chryseobacterium shigense TaxID=297244 RepID=A0A1N7JFN9_9FLAO|nr:DUF6493 family protein [Chryseobacterium shigense]PQA96707.1 hypothetical protein B0A69_01125 [Chryseobacterium shigense]SIS48129.1 hypothetical protein SAMN05421639_106174 [Chryseobacterium shigense]
MLIGDELKAIYLNYRIKEIVPFLIKLSPKEKKETAVILKKFLNKDWGHNHISMLATLACSSTQEEYEKLASAYYAWPIHLLDELFESYVPGWMGDCALFLRSIDYLKVLEWQQKGYLQLNDEVGAQLLSESITTHHTSEEILFTHPVTLDSHLWLMFQYDSSISCHDQNGRNWKNIFQHYICENKQNRSKVLESCLKAINLNLSKDHNSWFLELFSHLEPSSREILELQNHLFSVFHSPQSSLFVPVLKIINRVITEEDFEAQDFLKSAAALPSVQAKNILNSLLQTLDKIAGNDKRYRDEICLFLLPVFISKDAAIQIKAAKIIARYGDPDSGNIKIEIQSYAECLLSDPKVLLKEFLPDTEINKFHEPAENEEYTAWCISEPVSPIKTVSDFILFAPRVFSNNDPNDFDLFVDALMRFNTEISKEQGIRLEPAFKAACKEKGSVGMHHLYASFFIKYGLKNGSPLLNEARKEFPDFENWLGKRTPLIFKAYHQFLSDIFELLKQGKNLPLLSVPDHTPCWIDIRMLVDKLKIYQDQKIIPVPFDLQRAILRVKKEHLAESKKYAQKELSKEYFKYVEPVFDPEYFKDRYEITYLEGSFARKWGIRKIYKAYVAEEVPEMTVTIENKEIPEEAPLLDHLFNSYHGVYDHDLIRILYTAPYFSGSVFAKKCNETLSNAVNQYNSRTNIEFLDAWMKLDLPFQPVHYLFLSAALFSKDKTLSGTAFEAILHKIASDDFDMGTLGIMIGEKINFGLVPVKRLRDGIDRFIGLNSSHNRAFEKLLISILKTIDHPVFNLKTILEMYYELLQLNQSETNADVVVRLKEWENENNLKKMIIKLKTNERKIV